MMLQEAILRKIFILVIMIASQISNKKWKYVISEVDEQKVMHNVLKDVKPGNCTCIPILYVQTIFINSLFAVTHI